MLVLVRNGEAQLVEDVSNPGDDHLSRLIGAPELRRISLRSATPRGREIVAYVSDDPRGYVPNCRIEVARYPVYGPVVILASEGGRRCPLREDEILSIELAPPRGDDRLPCLRIKEDLVLSGIREGGTAA